MRFAIYLAVIKGGKLNANCLVQIQIDGLKLNFNFHCIANTEYNLTRNENMIQIMIICNKQLVVNHDHHCYCGALDQSSISIKHTDGLSNTNFINNIDANAIAVNDYIY